ncbi:MAG TPA: DUF2071 domain-containing protein [Opitutaceae bacterium]|jgi:uncharacterized protein YqjF (DUF2071 family)|nr:DUF2071 domain-containing protein [Opitutaceae bacterium]
MSPPTAAQRAATRVRPASGAVMYQRWRHLLFLHWSWDAAELQASLPPGLIVDTFQGQAWLAAVPFWMDRVRPRFLPPVPGLSWFLELNLRTYVHTADGTPGVWFYSLDCNQPLAVRIARQLFSLPYVWARQSGVRPTDKVPTTRFTSTRPGSSTNRFAYEQGGPLFHAAPGSLEYFLAERYLLFSRRRNGTLASGRVWHTPYPLAPARVHEADVALFADNGFKTPLRPADHAMVSPGVDVTIFPLRRQVDARIGPTP